jgi:hypothetical protein
MNAISISLYPCQYLSGEGICIIVLLLKVPAHTI